MKLGEVIRQWRYITRVGVREVAKQIGTSAGTLSRVERGENPDGATLAKILVWLLSK